MRDLQLIETDIQIARENIKALNEFLRDKPFMHDKFQFILKTLSEKIKALEHNLIEEKKSNEQIRTASAYNSVVNKTNLLQSMWFAKRQYRLEGKTEKDMQYIEEIYSRLK